MTDRNRTRDDPKVNVKVVLSGLWVSMLFVFAYVDIFGFWRTDVINGALERQGPRSGIRHQPDLLNPHDALHPHSEPDGQLLPHSADEGQQAEQPRCQHAVRRVGGGVGRRRNLGLLHRRQRGRSRAPAGHRRAAASRASQLRQAHLRSLLPCRTARMPKWTAVAAGSQRTRRRGIRGSRS